MSDERIPSVEEVRSRLLVADRDLAAAMATLAEFDKHATTATALRLVDDRRTQLEDYAGQTKAILRSWLLMREALERVEWAPRGSYDSVTMCPECGGFKAAPGHSDHCLLARALGRQP